MTFEKARQISKVLWNSNSAAEEKLRAKCRWEHMARTAVIMEWGDPRTWD